MSFRTFTHAFIRTFRMEVHWTRRCDRFWAGLSTDWMIEQVSMRSVKMSYGLTQGKRLSETQQLVWLMSTTPCRHVLQQCCICIYVTTLRTSQSDDILTFLITAIKLVNSIRTLTPLIWLITFPKEIHFPRIMWCAVLRNVDKRKEVEDEVLRSMVGKMRTTTHLIWKTQAVTLSARRLRG